MKTCSGLYTSLITPFNNGKIDEVTLKALLKLQRDNEVDGVVLLGSTGEGPTLSFNEKRNILHIARQEFKGNLIAGIGSPSTQISIEYAKMAEDAGMDGLLVVTPYYNRPSQEGIFRHFEEITRITKLPLIAYNHLARTGTNIDVVTMKRLAEIPQIIGLKETSQNVFQLMEILQAVKSKRKGFAVLSGDDFNTFPLMSLGGDGVICTASNLFPKKILELVRACCTNLTLARELHYQLLPLFQALSHETNPIPIKAAMAHFQLTKAEVRLPLTTLSTDKQKELIEALRRFS